MACGVLDGRTLDPTALWHDSLNNCRQLIVHMTTPNPFHVGFTFSAVDDPAAISDAIGALFDVVLIHSAPNDIGVDGWADYAQRCSEIDYRVQATTGFTIVDRTTIPISIFGAGGCVRSVPTW